MQFFPRPRLEFSLLKRSLDRQEEKLNSFLSKNIERKFFFFFLSAADLRKRLHLKEMLCESDWIRGQNFATRKRARTILQIQ